VDQGFRYADDITAIFLAGHGVTMGTVLFSAFDAEAGDLEVAALPSHQISSIITRINGKKILFLDTCHSGNAAKNGFNDINGFINEQSSESHAGFTRRRRATRSPWKTWLEQRRFHEALVWDFRETAFQEEKRSLRPACITSSARESRG